MRFNLQKTGKWLTIVGVGIFLVILILSSIGNCVISADKEDCGLGVATLLIWTVWIYAVPFFIGIVLWLIGKYRSKK